MKREWTLARRKVEREGVCRVCRTSHRIEAAHVIGREHDRDQGLHYAARTDDGRFVVSPDRIVPLCGPATDLNSCHGRYDAHMLDLIPYLHVTEVLQAVADCATARSNGLALAYKRIGGSTERIAA